ncbi:MAG: hypothetical protein AAGK28_07175 [Pseudomonadota bacterium]
MNTRLFARFCNDLWKLAHVQHSLRPDGDAVDMDDPSHRCSASLADELGAIRAQMRRLKDREAVLRRALLDRRPNAPVAGTQYVVHVRHGTSRRFDRAALPNEILQNPRYWRDVPTKTVVTVACDTPDKTATPAAVSCAQTPIFPGLNAPQDAFEVIEPF